LLSNFLENLQLTLFGQRKKRETPSFLPKEINFRTFEKRMFIEYQWAKHPTKLKEVGNTLVVSGDLHRTKVKRALNGWISKQAKAYFTPEIQRLSETTGLAYETLRFKNTKTRWGSCSEKKAINLNIQMLFLPKHLSHQVLLHELCHLTHLNHSKDFWNLVSSFEPNYRALERELKHDGRKYIPGWILRR
jgi:predicted metal-dependent hydrolase